MPAADVSGGFFYHLRKAFTVMTYMPIDYNNVSIPVLRLRAGKSHKIAAGVASARNAVAFNADTRVVSVYASVPVYIAFGASNVSVTNTGHYYPAGVYYDFSIGGGKVAHSTHLAIMAVGDTGDVYVSEKE